MVQRPLEERHRAKPLKESWEPDQTIRRAKTRWWAREGKDAGRAGSGGTARSSWGPGVCV